MSVTLETIARTAEVSTNTVSRALNNKPDINPATKKKILEIARQLGYTPNQLARSLKAGKTKTIGVVVSDISNPFFSITIKGIERYARERGYAIILCNSDEDYQREEENLNLLMQKRVDGVLITPVEQETSDIRKLQERKIPFVLVGRYLRDDNISYVVANDVLGSYLACEHLIKKHHTRILYLAGPSYVTTALERLEGYRKALLENHIPISSDLIIHTNAKMEDGYKAVKEALTRKLSFSAIAVFNDYLAFGAMEAIFEGGFRVPRDLAIIGYDDIEFALFCTVPLSTIRIPQYEMGMKAAQILIDIIDKKNTDIQAVRLDPKLIIRQST